MTGAILIPSGIVFEPADYQDITITCSVRPGRTERDFMDFEEGLRYAVERMVELEDELLVKEVKRAWNKQCARAAKVRRARTGRRHK